MRRGGGGEGSGSGVGGGLGALPRQALPDDSLDVAHSVVHFKRVDFVELPSLIPDVILDELTHPLVHFR